jgi:hypothetical protein
MMEVRRSFSLGGFSSVEEIRSLGSASSTSLAALCAAATFVCSAGVAPAAIAEIRSTAATAMPNAADTRARILDMERSLAVTLPTRVRPLVGPAAGRRVRATKAHTMGGLVVSVPLGGDVAAAAGEVDEAGGGTVQLGPGLYHLTSTIPLLSNITINGAGPSTIVQSPATPHAFPMVANVEEGIGNVVISNLVLDGNIPKGAFQQAGYGGAGVYLVALTNGISGVTFSNVEIKNTGIGLFLDGVYNIDVANSYVHDNNPGGYSHNAYFVGCTGVNITRSRFDNAWTGDGLHFDFGASAYTIDKSEFSGNNGIGILDQGGSQISVTSTIANYNQNDGFNFSSNANTYERDIANYDWGFGYDNGGGSGLAAAIMGVGDAQTFGQFFGDNFGQLFFGTSPNVYPAFLAHGATGPSDTADWSTTYPGYSTIGEVDFNQNHLANGLLGFDVGAVGAGNYTATIRYSNGTSGNLQMPVSVNGKAQGIVDFPPTGGWSVWNTTTVQLALRDGNNIVRVRPETTGAPELDYLQLDTSVPAPPAAPTNLKIVAHDAFDADLSWSPVPGAQSYTVYRSGLPAPLAVGLTQTSFHDSAILSDGQRYTYTVWAGNAGGGGPGATASVQLPLNAPIGFTVTQASGGNVLAWNPVNGATSYNVKRSTSTNGPFTTIANAGNATSYEDTTAQSGFQYAYVVSAVGGSGESANSYALPVNVPTNGDLAKDVGTAAPGITDFDPTTGTFGLASAGTGLWGNADGFRFEYLPVTGNVTLTARASLLQQIVPTSEVGLDIRATLDPSAPHVFVGLNGRGAESVVRLVHGEASRINGHVAGIAPPYFLQVARNGNVFTSSISPNGITWTDIGSVTIAMPANVEIGIAENSTVPNQEAIALLDSVSLSGSVIPSSLPEAIAAKANHFHAIGFRR